MASCTSELLAAVIQGEAAFRITNLRSRSFRRGVLLFLFLVAVPAVSLYKIADSNFVVALRWHGEPHFLPSFPAPSKGLRKRPARSSSSRASARPLTGWCLAPSTGCTSGCCSGSTATAPHASTKACKVGPRPKLMLR